MKQPYECTDLTDLHSQSEIKTKLISPDMMLAMLTNFDHVDILDSPLENPDTPVTKEAKAIRQAFKFGSEFNCIEQHPSNILNLLTNMVSEGLLSDAFKQYCIAYCNVATTPYADWTQEQLDAAKAEQALYVKTESTETGYPEFGSSQKWHVKLNNEKIRIAAKLDAAKAVNTVIELFAEVNDFDNDFVRQPRLFATITIAAGKLTGDVTISNTKPFSRRVKFTGVADTLGSYKLKVTSA